MILQRLYSDLGKKKLEERAAKKARKRNWQLSYLDPKETLGRASDEIREASKNQANEIVATGKRWKTLRNCPTITDETGALRVAREKLRKPGAKPWEAPKSGLEKFLSKFGKKIKRIK